MKLYTKRGDDGDTGLSGGERVPKDDLRVVAYGEVDETNAVIGLAVAGCDDRETSATLTGIQSQLFVLGAELAAGSNADGGLAIAEADVEQLERWIDVASAEVKPLKNFILPGGSQCAAALHLARTVCRRAERNAITLAKKEKVGSWVVPYLNRLSDLLFALARRVNQKAGVSEAIWTPPEP